MAEPFYQSGGSVEYPAESHTQSVWKHAAETPGIEKRYPTAFAPLEDLLQTDVVVVGGGITGVTSALLLQQAGYDVVLVDAHPIGYGVSAFNSGHLTSMLLDSHFKRVIASFGEENTRLVTSSICESIDLIERLIQDFRIECDFKRLPGYLYAEQTSQLQALRDEYEAATKAGLPIMRTFNVPLPFGVEEALFVPDQARFDPLRYVQALAVAFQAQGGRVFENTRVLDIVAHPLGEKTLRVMAEHGEIDTQDVILATHTPIGFRPVIQTRLEPIRSYIIGIRSDSPLEDALYWDMATPYHYLRVSEDEKGRLILIGGEDHKAGESSTSPERAFQRLENYALERMNVKSVDYRWSAHFYAPADGLPYIGKLSGVYVATGYSGEGLTFGTLAARLITDQICGIKNPCTEILQATRTKPLASVGSIVSESVSAVSHFVGDRLRKPDVENPQQIPLGDGAICQIQGKKMAVYHDSDGRLHYLSPICTHMNCVVAWNTVEKSWDCPCHGGRFDGMGKVLNGPPVLDLPSLDTRDT